MRQILAMQPDYVAISEVGSRIGRPSTAKRQIKVIAPKKEQGRGLRTPGPRRNHLEAGRGSRLETGPSGLEGNVACGDRESLEGSQARKPFGAQGEPI